MKIILDKEEYEQLRPNDLSAKVIDTIRRYLNDKDPANNARVLANIKEALDYYDADIANYKKDARFDLWP